MIRQTDPGARLLARLQELQLLCSDASEFICQTPTARVLHLKLWQKDRFCGETAGVYGSPNAWDLLLLSGLKHPLYPLHSQ